jgi:hypothetical protein
MARGAPLTAGEGMGGRSKGTARRECARTAPLYVAAAFDQAAAISVLAAGVDAAA